MKNNFISSIWEFDNSTEKRYSIHEIFRWYGKLPQFLVRRLIDMYSEENDTILANFSGSGTVLIESYLSNRNCVGIDAHPLSLLICKVKTNNFFPTDEKFIKKIQNKVFPDELYFEFKDCKKWFHKKSLIQIEGILQEICKIKNEKEKQFYQLCLARIIRDGSKVDSRCVNHIVVDNHKKEIDVVCSFIESVREVGLIIKDFSKNHSNSTTKIFNGDTRNLIGFEDESFDLVISHPPYANAVLYYNIYSLVSTILGDSYEEIKNNDISSSSFNKYLEDMKQVISENYRLLKSKKYACIIIGDIRKNSEIMTALPDLVNYGKLIGFRLKDIFIWKLVGKAGMSLARRGNHIDHNYIIIFQKP